MTDRNRDYDEYADSPEYYNIDPYTEPRQDAPQDDRSRYMGFMPTIPATTIPLVTFTHAIGTELQRLLRNRTNSLISRHATRTTASASSRQSPIPTPSNGTLAG